MTDLTDDHREIKDKLLNLVTSCLKEAKDRTLSFQQIEQKVMSGFMESAAQTIGLCLSTYDLDCPSVQYQGRRYDKSSTNRQDYFTCAGKVVVKRSMYRSKMLSKSICPMDLNAGIIPHNWTPQAAKIATLATAEMTPYSAAILFQEMGAMQPSKSTLDRLPKRLHDALNLASHDIASEVRASQPIPQETAQIAVSLDGVHVPIQKLKGKKRFYRDCGFTQTRGELLPILEGHSPYREAGCGTVSYLDKQGQLLHTHYYGRMPQSRKAELKAYLEEHVKEDLKRCPDLEIIAIADGARDNWTFLESAFPESIQVLDFYHAAEHLKKAIDVVYKDETKANLCFKEQRSILRHDKKGIDKVITFLESLYCTKPAHDILLREINYFRSNRARCQYYTQAKNNHPIGSGMVEAACKMLVAKRLKCSGMAWRWKGGQAILSFRSYLKSNRFNELWDIISEMYLSPVYP